MNELLDDLALRLRHNAAMDQIETAADELARWELLLTVLCPSARLLETSRAAAEQHLHHKRRRDPVAA